MKISKKQWREGTHEERVKWLQDAARTLDATSADELENVYRLLSTHIELFLGEKLHIYHQTSDGYRPHPGFESFEKSLAKAHRSLFGFHWLAPHRAPTTAELEKALGPLDARKRQLIGWCNDVLEYAGGGSPTQTANEVVRYAKELGKKATRKEALRVIAALEGGPVLPCSRNA